MKGQAMLIIGIIIAGAIIALAIAQGEVNVTQINQSTNTTNYVNITNPFGVTLPFQNITGFNLSSFPMANTTYAGTTIPYNNISNPTATHGINFGAFNTTWTFTTPSKGFDIEGIGAFSDDLLHIHQHTGNPSVTDLVHLEAEDADVTVLNITGIKQPVLDAGGSIIARGGNVTATEKICLNLACTKFIHSNGTHIIINNSA